MCVKDTVLCSKAQENEAKPTPALRNGSAIGAGDCKGKPSRAALVLSSAEEDSVAAGAWVVSTVQAPPGAHFKIGNEELPS